MPEYYQNTLFQAGCDSGVAAHCRKVAEVAGRFSGESVDKDLVYAGAMLHDIGRSKTHSIEHAGAGAEICRRLEFSGEIIQIVGRHTGAGLTEDESVLLGLPPKSAVPETLEEKIVAHADNLVKGTLVITIEERLKLAENLSEGARGRMRRLAAEMEVFRE